MLKSKLSWLLKNETFRGLSFQSPWSSLGNVPASLSNENLCSFCQNVLPSDYKKSTCPFCCALIPKKQCDKKVAFICEPEVESKNSEERLANLSLLNTLVTVLSTFFLRNFPSKPWIITSVAGGFTSLSLWLKTLEEKKEKSDSPRSVKKIYDLLSLKNKSNDLSGHQYRVENLWDNLFEHRSYHNFCQNFLQALLESESHSTLPLADEIKKVKPPIKNWHLRLDLSEVLEYMSKKTQKGPLYESIETFRAIIKRKISLDISSVFFPKQSLGKMHSHFMASFFELVRTQKEKVSISISGNQNFDVPFDTVVVGKNVETIKISGLTIAALPPSIWNVSKGLELDNINKLEQLPEMEEDGDENLDLQVRNTPLKALPRSIVRRPIGNLDLSGCRSLKHLPTTFIKHIQKRQLLNINLEETDVDKRFRKKMNFEGRSLSECICAQEMSKLFYDQSCNRVEDQKPDLLKTKTNSAFVILKTLGFLVPSGLLALTINRLVNPKADKVATEKLPFWLTFVGTGITAALITCGAEKVKIARGYSNKTLNVDAVWALTHKKGLEKISDCHCIDWDKVWSNLFSQSCYLSRPTVPSSIKDFLHAWIGIRPEFADYSSPLSKCVEQFVEENGGQTWARKISKLPFGEMLDLIEQKALDVPMMDRIIKDFRDSIGYGLKKRVCLKLEDFIVSKTKKTRPSIPYKDFQSLFALIGTGTNMRLTIDWDYYCNKQRFPAEIVPFSTRFHSVTIKNAIMEEVPETIWLTKHNLRIINAIGFKRLPILPKHLPCNRLSLELIDVPISCLPHNIHMRQFSRMVLNNCREVSVLPYNLREQIEKAHLTEVILKGTKITPEEIVYAEADIKKLLLKPFFAHQDPPICAPDFDDHFDHHHEEKVKVICNNNNTFLGFSFLALLAGMVFLRKR